ncbi:MAG: acyl carrier protein [Candidatus Paceibacterota bacterium]
MKEEIIETVRTTLYLKPDQVSEDTLLEKIAKDSMDIVELIAVLSDKYKVSIEPSKMNHIKTVGDIVDYIIHNEGSSSNKSPIESF